MADTPDERLVALRISAKTVTDLKETAKAASHKAQKAAARVDGAARKPQADEAVAKARQAAAEARKAADDAQTDADRAKRAVAGVSKELEAEVKAAAAASK